MTIARVLIVAGSDSGGGAGIQADIKTVTMLGGHAMTAITAITAQNTMGVQAVHPVPTDMVVAQMRSCIDDLGVDAVKIGMIGSAETAHAVADVLEALTSRTANRHPGLDPGSTSPRATASPGETWTPDQVRGDEEGASALMPIVFDPVMVATSGAVLADADTISAFARLMRLATVTTPNTFELAALADRRVRDESDRDLAVERLMDDYGCRAVLAKGGHLDGPRVRDLLFEQGYNETAWETDRIDTRHTHGTGCTLASGVAVGLAQGLKLPAACERAIDFVRAALAAAAPEIGAGHGPLGHALATIPYDRCRG